MLPLLGGGASFLVGEHLGLVRRSLSQFLYCLDVNHGRRAKVVILGRRAIAAVSPFRQVTGPALGHLVQ